MAENRNSYTDMCYTDGCRCLQLRSGVHTTTASICFILIHFFHLHVGWRASSVLCPPTVRQWVYRCVRAATLCSCQIVATRGIYRAADRKRNGAISFLYLCVRIIVYKLQKFIRAAHNVPNQPNVFILIYFYLIMCASKCVLVSVWPCGCVLASLHCKHFLISFGCRLYRMSLTQSRRKIRTHPHHHHLHRPHTICMSVEQLHNYTITSYAILLFYYFLLTMGQSARLSGDGTC